MRQTLLGINVYAADFDGDFPEKLTDLLDEGYIDNDLVMHSHRASGTKGEMFLYRAGFKSVSPADEPILLSPKAFFAGKRVVGFVDGRVQALSPAELVGTVEKFE
jgi:phosphopantothenate synthetase